MICTALELGKGDYIAFLEEREILRDVVSGEIIDSIMFHVIGRIHIEMGRNLGAEDYTYESKLVNGVSEQILALGREATERLRAEGRIELYKGHSKVLLVDCKDIRKTDRNLYEQLVLTRG
jgi:hypothetical protein